MTFSAKILYDYRVHALSGAERRGKNRMMFRQNPDTQYPTSSFAILARFAVSSSFTINRNNLTKKAASHDEKRPVGNTVGPAHPLLIFQGFALPDLAPC